MVDATVIVGGSSPVPSGSDLTTLSDVKAWLQLTHATDDVLLQRLITSASLFIQSWLNRKFAVANYTEVRNGNGGRTQALANYPVISVNSVTIGSTVIPLSNGQTSGYVYDDKFIYLNGYIFDRGMQNVTIQTTAGYQTIPFEISQACIELVSLRYKERNRIGEISKSLGGSETVSYSQKDMSDDVKSILRNYKKVISL